MPFDVALGAAGLMAFIEEITLAARARDHDVLIVTAEEGVDGLRRRRRPGAVRRRGRHGGQLGRPARRDRPRTAGADAVHRVSRRREGLHCIDFDFEDGARLLVGELSASTRVSALVWGSETVDRG